MTASRPASAKRPPTPASPPAAQSSKSAASAATVAKSVRLLERFQRCAPLLIVRLQFQRTLIGEDGLGLLAVAGQGLGVAVIEIGIIGIEQDVDSERFHRKLRMPIVQQIVAEAVHAAFRC